MKKRFCRIKVGAIVFSDHSFPHWGEHIGKGQETRPFVMSPMDTSHNRYDLRAWGFGLSTAEHGEGAYGNGSLFVRAEDIEIVELEGVAIKAVYRSALPLLPKPKKLKPGYYLVVGDGYSDIVKCDSIGGFRELGSAVVHARDHYTGNPHWYGPLDLHDIMTANMDKETT